MAILPAIANLTNFQIGFVFLLILSIALFINFLKRFGILSKLRFTKTQLPSMEYLYTQFLGPYGQLSQVYDKVFKDTKAQFNQTKSIGISYDDPKHTSPSHCRSVVGLSLPQTQKSKIVEFIKMHPEYKHQSLQSSQIIKTSVPMTSRLSFLLIPFKAIPGLFKYLSQNKIQREFPGCIQLYGMPEQQIVICYPLTKISQFNLTTYPKQSESKKQS